MQTSTEIVKGHASDASVHLDAIRGLAALTVFLSHSRTMYLRSGLRDMIAGGGAGTGQEIASSSNESIFHAHLKFSSLVGVHQSVGRFAVIIFFVLSGYFVGGSVLRAARKGKFSWNTYAFQRMTRLWVVLIPALLLGWALDAFALHFFSSPLNIYRNPASYYNLANLSHQLSPGVFFGNLFFVQGILTPTLGTNDPLWSLAYEFWFYLMFPLLFFACSGTRSTARRIVSGALLCGCLLISGWRIDAYFLVWGCGVAASILPLNLSQLWRRAIGYTATAALFIAMFLELKLRPNIFVGDMVLGLIVLAIVWTILHLRQSSLPPWYRRPAQGLSKMSYTLYLVHLPMLVFISGALFPVWTRWKISAQSITTVAAINVVVMVMAWIMYYLFERNTEQVRRLIGGSAPRRPAPQPAVTKQVAEVSEVS